MSRETRRSAVPPEVGKYMGLGLTWAISTLLFLWLGTVADGWLGTEPALTLIGAFVGAGAGFYWMIHHLVIEPRRRAERDDSDERGRKEREGREGG